MGIVKKIIIGLFLVSGTTYSTSAFFIFVLQDLYEFPLSETTFTLLTFAAGIFWTVLLGGLAARWYIQPLLELEKISKSAAAGNLSVSVQESRSKDEVGALVRAFGQMIHSLRTMINEVSSSSSITNHNIENLSSGITEAARQIDNISSLSGEIRLGAEQQEASTGSALNSFLTIQESVEEIKQHASSSAGLSSEMMQLMQSVIAHVQTLIDSMRQLVLSNRESAEKVSALQVKADQINDFSRMVGDIAQQTHLLALNATIEAAHAGEQGRGFQVVAEEISKLARQSEDAVSHIDQLISEIHREVHEVAGQIQDQAQTSEREFDQTRQVTDMMKQVSRSTESVSSSVHQIERMIAEQANVFQSIVEEIRQIAEVSSDIFGNAKQVSDLTLEQNAFMQELVATFDELKGIANELQKNTNQFKLA